MTTMHDYLTLNPAQRDRVRSAVRDLAVRTNERYADLLAVDAVLAARAVYPGTHRLVFRLGDDVTGTTATLVAAYDRTGAPLWHVERNEEWEDESELTDLLAACVDWYDGYFPFTRLSRLCGCECPCVLDLTDFRVGGLSWARAHKTSGDDGASQGGEHVSEGRVGFGQVPRR